MSETLASIVCCAPLGASVLSEEEALATADVFRALGDGHRVRIVNLLATRGQALCVDEFIEPLGVAQSTVSHHLKKLAEAGLLDREERGKWTYYSLNIDALRTLAAVADLRGVCC